MAFDEFNGAMFSPKWSTSERKHGVLVSPDVKVAMSDGIKLNCDVFRPDSGERFPAILGFHCYHQSGQTGPLKPAALSTAQWRNPGQERTNASLESGDPNFFVRRGYVHVLCNARGTGKSEGNWDFVGPRELRDVYEVIEWIANQPYCDGNVVMFGVSYFAWIQLFAATLQPPHLKCLFSPWAGTDFYRDLFYRGGIVAPSWPIGWGQTSLTYSNCRPENHSKNEMGVEAYQNAIGQLLEDDDFRAIPEAVQVLRNPESGVNPFVVDLLLHPLYDRYWQERTVEFDKITVPAYLGADWAGYGQHLPGALRSWERLNVPKKLIIGPPIYLDRPLYQLQHEAVRWFDHWVKGKETGIMDEPPVRIFIMGTNEWKATNDWPLPETKWTPFYLHEGGLLSEHEYWPNEGFDSFHDSPWGRGHLKYSTPPLVENTEIAGPIVLKLQASTSDVEIHWIVSLLEIDPDGNERILTKGWLRGSHREIDLARSKPWAPVHPHTRSEPLTPGKIYDFDISLVATGNMFKPGSRIGLKISCSDDEPKNPLELIACGSLLRQSISRITLYRNADHPSCLILPITKGNVLGTYMSGGQFPTRS